MINKPDAATFGSLIDQVLSLSQSKVERVWLGTEFLAKQEDAGDGSFGPFPKWMKQTDERRKIKGLPYLLNLTINV